MAQGAAPLVYPPSIVELYDYHNVDNAYFCNCDIADVNAHIFYPHNDTSDNLKKNYDNVLLNSTLCGMLWEHTPSIVGLALAIPANWT